MSAEKINRLTTSLYRHIGYLDVNAPEILNENLKPLKVMSYNILAQSLKPLNDKFDATRGKRVSELIMADMPDIVCMQELDIFMYKDLDKKLYDLYDELYFEKPWFESHAARDGILTLYNKKRFILLEKKEIWFNEETNKLNSVFDEVALERFVKRNSQMQLMIFKDLQNDNRTICIGNSHLIHLPTHDDVKYIQTVLMYKLSMKFAIDYDFKNNQPEGYTQIILSGDLNTLPMANAAQIH